MSHPVDSLCLRCISSANETLGLETAWLIWGMGEKLTNGRNGYCGFVWNPRNIVKYDPPLPRICSLGQSLCPEESSLHRPSKVGIFSSTNVIVALQSTKKLKLKMSL